MHGCRAGAICAVHGVWATVISTRGWQQAVAHLEKVPALDHEPLDDPVKLATLVANRDASLAAQPNGTQASKSATLSQHALYSQAGRTGVRRCKIACKHTARHRGQLYKRT